jgi:DNA-binding transcriptional MocR family regulator
MASHTKKIPINLLRGWPNTSLLPVAQIKVACNTALSDPTVAHPGLLYGPDPGYEPLRVEIGKWLSAFYQPSKVSKPIDAKRICITGGASQNLACVLQEYTDPLYTRNVWMVAPTYFLACRIMEDSGFAGKLRAVPEDDEGVDIDYLASAIKKSEENAEKGGNIKPVSTTSFFESIKLLDRLINEWKIRL